MCFPLEPHPGNIMALAGLDDKPAPPTDEPPGLPSEPKKIAETKTKLELPKAGSICSGAIVPGSEAALLMAVAGFVSRAQEKLIFLICLYILGFVI